jgi:hypothetical protein
LNLFYIIHTTQKKLGLKMIFPNKTAHVIFLFFSFFLKMFLNQ